MNECCKVFENDYYVGKGFRSKRANMNKVSRACAAVRLWGGGGEGEGM